MARLQIVLLVAIAAYTVSANGGDDHGDGQVHNHYNYYGTVHNHHGDAGYHGDQHDDHPDDHHDDEHDDHHDDEHDDHHDDDDEEHHDEHHDDHVYRFRVDSDFPGYSYKNDKGEVVGFSSELLMTVCERAHKQCRWLVDSFSHCWSTEGGQHPGEGLLDNWYDGCIGVVPTQDRRNSFNFTESFSEPVHWRLYFKAAHDGNLDNVKVGFVDGYSMGPDCFSQHFHGQFEAVTLPSLQALFEAMQDGTVDAAPSEDNAAFATKHGFVAHGESFVCHDDGLAIMTQYGSDVINWWNAAFDEFVHSGDFREFCRQQQLFHGHSGDIHCNH